MHSGAEQTSLWEQSDLLDLVGAAEAGDPQGSVRGATNPEPGDGAESSATGPACVAAEPPSMATTEPSVAWEQQDGATSPSELPQNGSPSASGEPDASSGVGMRITPTAVVTPAGGAQIPQASDACITPPCPEPRLAPPTAPDAAATAAQAAQATAPADERGAATHLVSGSLPPQALPACPQRLLILDTETTALSPQQGQCIEVGAVLFDVTSRSVLMQVSFLMPCTSNPAEHVNGIPAAVSRLQQPWRSGLACFEAMAADADALLAHNAAFDRQWFGCGELPPVAKPWICSMEDIRWPAERQLRATPSVRDLALAYGVPVWAAHRALTDCIYLVQVFQRCEELEPLLQAALEPRRLVRARLSYDERQLAKDAGFRWNEPVPKAWSRRLSDREIAALPFAVDPVEAEEPGRQRRQEAPPLWRRSA